AILEHGSRRCGCANRRSAVDRTVPRPGRSVADHDPTHGAQQSDPGSHWRSAAYYTIAEEQALNGQAGSLFLLRSLLFHRCVDFHLLLVFQPDPTRPIFISVRNQPDLIIACAEFDRARGDSGVLAVDVNIRRRMAVDYQYGIIAVFCSDLL